MVTPRRGPAIEPREIKQSGDTAIAITYADEQACEFTAARLRRACPCAQCVNEWTGERVLEPASIPDDIRINDISIVGRYALNFKWSDGHDTGIYSFQYLRELCELNGSDRNTASPDPTE